MTRKTWMAGTSPAMTECNFQPVGRNSKAYCADRELKSAEYAALFRPTRYLKRIDQVRQSIIDVG